MCVVIVCIIVHQKEIKLGDILMVALNIQKTKKKQSP